MNILGKLYTWYGKMTVNAVFAVLAILVVTAVVIGSGGEPVATETTSATKPVRVASVSELAGDASLSLIGTVEAVSESMIQSETSGRVTRVHAELGATVAPGAIIVELENASERAAVLQAEGVYEAALVSSAQSNTSITDAQNAVESAKIAGVQAYRNAFNISDDAIRNLVDDFFTNVHDPIFGFRIDAQGQAPALINERKALEVLLDDWYARVESGVDPENVVALLEEAKDNTEHVAAYVDRIALLVSRAEPDSGFSESDLSAYNTQFLSTRSSFTSVLGSINNNLHAIQNADEALTRAKLGGSATELSAASAQVKQALGALRGAQANLAQTVIRTSIGGTVNALPVRTGDFIGAFTHVATVANNGSLLITTYITEENRSRVSIGDMVRINNAATGTISNIAPVVDVATKKIEVKIQVDEPGLVNGDTVRIALTQQTADAVITTIKIPISALKVETNRTVVFTHDSNYTLVAHPVETGPLLGENIIIESGITPEMVIVLDARGLNEGDHVNVIE